MIFKRRSKLFWVEAFIYLAIFVTCILGSYGVFDAKAQESDGKVDTCIEWINMPSDLRVKLLRIGMITEIRKSDLGEAAKSLVNCLNDIMPDLDKAIVDECSKDTEKFLEEAALNAVVYMSLESVIFRCLKWINVERTNETSRY